MAGVPLLNGFLSKEMFFGETLHLGFLGPLDWIVPLFATVAGVLAVAYSARFVHDVFFNGEPIDLPKTPHEPPRWMKVPVEVLVVVCLLIGIFPQYSVQGLLDVAAAAVKGDGVIPEHTLAVWHGFNLPLLMSCIAFIGGVGVYALRHRLFAWHDRVFPPVSAKGLADDHLGWALKLSQRITDTIENGSVQRSVALLLISTVVLVAVPFVLGSQSDVDRVYTPVDAIGLLGATALILGALVAVKRHRERYQALVFVGAVGLFTSLTFVRFAAPDLALTQLVVEVTTIILLLLVLFYLPQTTPRESSSFRQYRDVALALVCGVGMAGITWALLTSPFESISGYFLQNSLPEGGGHNVVNVILADFRGFDTMGEAVVLAIAAIGIYGMLDGVRMSRPETDRFGNQWDPDTHPLILARASRTLLPLALLVAVYFYLRGHNAPGGGFVAGLIVGTALTLQYLANGIEWAKSRLVPDYRPVVGLGVLVAGGTGLAALVFGSHFLSQSFIHLDLPVVGEFEIASAMLFEGGIFLAVVGTVLLILVGIGQLSLPAPTTPDQGEGR
jgi:multicomponent K+:H+ antiporter subunit A